MASVGLTAAALGAGATLGLFAWTSVGYPWWLRRRGTPAARHPPPATASWPAITVVLPVHNEAARLPDALGQVFREDYPADRLQVLVVSDASTDGTDAIVRSFADAGVTLLRLPRRSGKSAAEQLASTRTTGSVVVSFDAGVSIRRGTLKALVRALEDPMVGAASGRDVSVGAAGDPTAGEGEYVGYEMRVRDLETRGAGLVGLSGCCFAVRADVYREPVPPRLSRDFAMALVARTKGYRAVAVADAVCFVPRSGSLRREYRRKVRTVARGLATLWHWRGLLNPVRHGVFAVQLWSHKVCRWLLPWGAATTGIALLVASPVAGLVAVLGGAGCLAVAWRRDGNVPTRPLRVLAYGGWTAIAILHATYRAARGRAEGAWEPTRRPGVSGHLEGAAPAEHDGDGAPHDLEILER